MLGFGGAPMLRGADAESADEVVVQIAHGQCGHDTIMLSTEAMTQNAAITA